VPDVPPSTLRDAPFGTPRRWGVFLIGLACLLPGIALSIRAELGVGSWQVFETGLVEATGAGYGTVVLAEAAVALAIAWLWFGERPWIATAVLAFGGIVIGALLEVIETPATVPGQVALLAAGIALLATGVAFYLASDLGASAQDALFVGFYRRYGVRPAVVRFTLDASLVAAGFALGGQLGLGTVAVTLLVPALIEPALRLGHRLAATPVPAALVRAPRVAAPAPASTVPPAA